MARFLMMTAPATGHIRPTLPIVRKLIERGHEVVWMTGHKFKEKIEAAGARFHPLPEEMDPGDKEIYQFYPKLKELKGITQIKYYMKHVFLDTCAPLIASLNEVIEHFPADVLVGDTLAYGLYFRSELEGPPSAMISLLPLSIVSRDTAPWGLGILPGKNIVTKIRNRLLNFYTYHMLFRDVTSYANMIRHNIGLGPLKGSFFKAKNEIPSLVVHLSTPAFEYPRTDQPDTLHFVGPILPEAKGEFQPPSWWQDLNNSEPVILVNQGTMGMDLKNLMIPTIRALADQKMLVVAVPAKDGDISECPENVRAEPFIPFDQLLPHVDVMVTNGGYGGTQMALAYGVPLVVAGETEDKTEVAARVEWAGAGVNLRTLSPSLEEVRNAVQEVLSNPIYRQNAKRVQADFAKYDAPLQAVELLEDLVKQSNTSV